MSTWTCPTCSKRKTATTPKPCPKCCGYKRVVDWE